jgi:hypothetical protein
MRAERRVGELMQAQRETVGLATGGDATRARVQYGPEREDVKPTLADAGIDKHLADRARKIDPVLEVLLEVLDVLKDMRQQLSQQQRPSHLTRKDRAALEAILPAVAGAIGSELFTSAELFEHEAPGVRLVVGKLNAKKLGWLLKRAVGTSVGGFTVKQDGTECGSVLWRVLATTSLSL